jgi:hypothetical protein
MDGDGMKVTEAVRFVEGLAFKPGWQPTAEVYTASGLVELSFIIRTVDTSYPDPDGVCRRQITIYGQQRLVNVRDMDETDLLAEVLKCAADNDMHENREFLKVRQPDGSWHAPLHPHTNAGNRAWDQRKEPARKPAATSAAGLMQLLGLED